MENNHSFTRNVLILTVAPIAAAMVSLLAEPFIARFFAPEVYGPGMIFATVILTLSPIMFLRYNFAIVQASDKKEAANILVLCLILFVCLLILASTLLYAFPQISIKLVNFNFSTYTIYFVLSLFFTSIAFLMKYWFSYKKIFYMLTINTLITQISAVIFLLILGGLGYRNTESYIVGRTVSFIIGPSVFMFYFFKNDLKKMISQVTGQGLLSVLRKYKNFPLFEYWGFLAAIVVVQVPLFMISKFWGASDTGLYAKAFAILSLFTLTVGDSVHRVFHREIAGRIQDGTPIEDFIINLIKIIIKITIIPFMLMSLIGGEIFNVLLGARWEEAGIIGGILVPWFFFAIISFSIRPLYNLFYRQKIYTIITFIFLLSWSAIFIICHLFNLSLMTTLIIYSSFAAACFITEISFLLNLIHLRYKVILIFIIRKLIEIIPLVLFKWIMVILHFDKPFILLLSYGVLSVVYLYYYIFKDPFIFSFIKNSLIKR